MSKYIFKILPPGFLFGLSLVFLWGCMPRQQAVGPYPPRIPQSDGSSQKFEAKSQSAPPSHNDVQNGGREGTTPIIRHDGTAADSGPDIVVSSLALVNDRIIAYENKRVAWEKLIREVEKINLNVEQKNKIDSCRQQLQNILTGYNRLHERLLQEGPGQSDDSLIEDLLLNSEKDDIGFIESDCQHFLNGEQQAGGWLTGTRNSIVQETGRNIDQAMVSNDYQQVISLYEQLLSDPGQKFSYDMTLNYGQALMRSGREQDAIAIFQGLLATIRQQDQVRKEFNLMSLIADLQLGLEDYDDASKSYGELISRYNQLGERNDWARLQQMEIHSRDGQKSEVQAYAAVLHDYLAYNPDRDGFNLVLQAQRFLDHYPESQVAAEVNRILQKSRSPAEKWFAGLVAEINGFKADKQYHQGLLRVAQMSSLELPVDKQEELRALQDSLMAAQVNDAEQQRLSMEQAQQEDWRTAQVHLEAKEYDKAIEVFKHLLATPFAERATARIQEAEQLAAQDDRRKAAEFFVRAGRTQDLDNKKRLLLTSRELLQNILVKYPQTDIIDKVNRNLKRIDEEILAIDPAFTATLPPGPDLNDSPLQQRQNGDSHEKTLPVDQNEIQMNTDNKQPRGDGT